MPADPLAEMTESDLLLVVQDMETWWNRGATATSEAQTLGNQIKAHLSETEYQEDDDTLEFLPDGMRYRLQNLQFDGLTSEMRNLAATILDADDLHREQHEHLRH